MKRKVFFTLKSLAYFSIIALLLSSCVSQKKTRMIQEKTVKGAGEFANSKSTVYHLQSGDQLFIKVYSTDPKTSRLFQSDFPNPMTNTFQNLNSYKIDEGGYINFSFIDKMYVKGLTEKEVNDLLQGTISEYFKEATVVVKLVNYRVSILGEVNDPGTFIIENRQINILQAIAQAGGLSNFGNAKKAKLVRQTVDGSVVYALDLTDNGLLLSDQFYLLPNDVLYIESLGSKSFAFERFPYELFLSIVTAGALVYTIFQ